MDAALLEENGWLRKVRGHVITQEQPTCNDHTIDYAVVSEALRDHVAGIRLLEQAPVAPHVPLLIRFRSLGYLGTVLWRRTWQSFPPRGPCGPSATPTDT